MRRGARQGLALLAAAGSCLLLAGCVYDYSSHEDRLSYSAGDAVAANLMQETINPEDPAMYSKAGLGRNGNVVPNPVTETKTSATTVSSTSATTSP